MAGYIGNAPVPQATQTRDNFTATAGQTSFATSGYTPGYLDVYLNGVRLDESDYTATNGSDVVLDTGAAVDDVVTVVAFQTFEVSADIDNAEVKTKKLIVDGANGNGTFNIVGGNTDNGSKIQAWNDAGTGDGYLAIEGYTKEYARFDASGNLLVGTTSTNPSGNNDASGVELSNVGQVNISRSGANALDVNRGSSDGEIVRFRKDGTTVGSIGSTTGAFQITSSRNELNLGSRGSAQSYMDMTGGVAFSPFTGSDATGDLGRSSARFKDLYLSGGVYLGGTTSANHLDDYEEGTWTPVISDWYTGWTSTTGVTYTNNRYTKVGNLVHLTVNISGVSASTGKVYAYFSGLPFTPNFTSYGYGSSSWYQGAGENSGAGFAGVSTGGLLLVGNYNHYTTSTSDGIGVTLIYRTDS